MKKKDSKHSYLKLIPQASLDLIVDSIARSLNLEKGKGFNEAKIEKDRNTSFEQLYLKAKSMRIEDRAKLSKKQLLDAIKRLKFKSSSRYD